MMTHITRLVKIVIPLSIVLEILLPITCTQCSSEILKNLLKNHGHSFKTTNNGRDLTHIMCTCRTQFDPHYLI